jgi:hypothetical protein
MSSMAQLLILFSPNYMVRLFCIMILGLAQNLKNGQCYTFGFEIVPKKYGAFVCSAINFWDCTTLFWINLYVLFVSKHWQYIYAFYTFIGLCSLLLFAICVPESPKWLTM